MTTKSVLLVGGTGGIGGALLENLLADQNVGPVFATSSREISSTHPKLRWLLLDYKIAGATDKVAQVLINQLANLDLFLCTSGYLHGDDGQPEKSLSMLEKSTMDMVYRLNASGPLELLARCAPLLRAATAPRALFLSAQVGSIEDNRLGGWFSYRMAKAALNMGIRTAAIEASRWRNDAVILAVHPGTTRSALSKPFITRRKNPVSSTADTAALIYKLLRSVPQDRNGSFLTATGSSLPW